MCFKYNAPDPPPPPPLPPAPPPPPAPTAPLPEDDLVSDTEINPKVREAKSAKESNQQRLGTQGLRISRDPQVNTGTAGGGGGVNV